METLFTNPVFGILLTLIAFEIGIWLQKKTRFMICNPLLIAIIIIILLLLCTNIPLADYQKGADIINLFLGPATVVLAIPLYRQVHNLKHYALPIIIGIITGILTSLLSTLLCCWLFGFDTMLTASMMPKSITTPIGIELSIQLGGIPAITVLTILVTGIIGAMIADTLFKRLHIEHPIARGIALGTSAHAIGTTKALQLGNIEGAMSSLAIGVSGLCTVFITSALWPFLQQIL